MADTTANLKMPFILPSQAQKHVTHNEALLQLDALVHLTIMAEQAAPPASPEEGMCYFVAASPSGAWTGKAGRIAAWQDGHWAFTAPRTGWRAWFASSARLRVFTGAAWQDIPLPATGSLDHVGINAASDTTNRLALSSAASLFSHAGGGHQVKVNKAGASDTASLLFQTGFTGYAEMGLAGDNRFSIKVSDGTTWKTGLSISSAGAVSRPSQPVARAFRSGSTFSPASGQQSGFTTLDVNQGGFALGTSEAGGGSRIVVPATGLYLVALNLAVLTSSGYGVGVMRNGSQTLTSLKGLSGGPQTQCACGVFLLDSADFITLAHSGTAQFEGGAGKTELSISML